MIPAHEILSWAIAISFVSVAISQLLAMIRLVIGPGPGD